MRSTSRRSWFQIAAVDEVRLSMMRLPFQWNSRVHGLS
jgi:hypothetical protein